MGGKRRGRREEPTEDLLEPAPGPTHVRDEGPLKESVLSLVVPLSAARCGV